MYWSGGLQADMILVRRPLIRVVNAQLPIDLSMPSLDFGPTIFFFGHAVNVQLALMKEEMILCCCPHCFTWFIIWGLHNLLIYANRSICSSQTMCRTHPCILLHIPISLHIHQINYRNNFCVGKVPFHSNGSVINSHYLLPQHHLSYK